MEDDPYRSSQQTGTCPRCQNETASDGELGRLVCVRGCGEWYSKDKLDELESWRTLANQPGGFAPAAHHAPATSWPWGAALCPICQRPMSVGFQAEVRFDYCNQHGVWLDAGEIQRFAQVFKLS
jgi:Zn-finger nucleic acid-binding protein